MARGRQRVGARGHGRTMEEWVALVEASGIDPLDQNAFQRCLKDAHGVRIADEAAIRAGRVGRRRQELLRTAYGQNGA